MLQCEGYKMFKGIMKVTSKFIPTTNVKNVLNTKNNRYELIIDGTWLYKPEYDCWYCKGSSYPASVCEIMNDETK